MLHYTKYSFNVSQVCFVMKHCVRYIHNDKKQSAFTDCLSSYYSEILLRKLRGISLSRQSPNAHVNMVTWLAACGNKDMKLAFRRIEIHGTPCHFSRTVKKVLAHLLKHYHSSLPAGSPQSHSPPRFSCTPYSEALSSGVLKDFLKYSDPLTVSPLFYLCLDKNRLPFWYILSIYHVILKRNRIFS